MGWVSGGAGRSGGDENAVPFDLDVVDRAAMETDGDHGALAVVLDRVETVDGEYDARRLGRLDVAEAVVADGQYAVVDAGVAAVEQVVVDGDARRLRARGVDDHGDVEVVE